ncbi:hypothetical protein BJY52DRAFT_1220506 [Lactarius psammicola]|nr:hypothetical protein BJY52DRAFT_1220506 [Lactarius psammicola]
MVREEGVTSLPATIQTEKIVPPNAGSGVRCPQARSHIVYRDVYVIVCSSASQDTPPMRTHSTRVRRKALPPPRSPGRVEACACTRATRPRPEREKRHITVRFERHSDALRRAAGSAEGTGRLEVGHRASRGASRTKSGRKARSKSDEHATNDHLSTRGTLSTDDGSEEMMHVDASMYGNEEQAEELGDVIRTRSRCVIQKRVVRVPTH